MTCILGNNETKYSIVSSLMERDRHHGRTLNHACRGIAGVITATTTYQVVADGEEIWSRRRSIDG
jgi:hypothetical protein